MHFPLPVYVFLDTKLSALASALNAYRIAKGWVLLTILLAQVDESACDHCSNFQIKSPQSSSLSLFTSIMQNFQTFRTVCYSYQKTETAIKTTAGKTTSVLGGITSKMTQKISDMKQSDSFRSFEERVGSAYENVRVSPNLVIFNVLQAANEHITFTL